MDPSFWNERYGKPGFAYGTAPNAFLAAEAHRIAAGAAVVDLGAGEGRNAVFFAARGCRVTAVDTSEAGLAKATRLAAAHGVPLDTACADVLAWTPPEPVDAVVVAFLHLPSGQRPALYAHVQAMLRPGGVLLAEWFRPEQLRYGYPSGGPRASDLLIPPDELRRHFAPDGIQLMEHLDTELNEGPFHQGRAAVVRLVWRRPEAFEPEPSYVARPDVIASQ